MTILEYPSAAPTDSQHARGNWFLWAIYLAMSWTWCIGMFLPVLLVRDFGIWGWIVFAIPNVIGAAAVGWINRTAEQSKYTVAAHLPMMAAFSWITATFQIFFGCWIFHQLSVNTGSAGFATFISAMLSFAVIVFAFVAVAYPAARARNAGRIVAVFVLAFSLLCMIALWHSRVLYPPQTLIRMFSRPFSRPSSPRIIGIGFATFFGFLLCPHLDLTFHRARQQMSRTSAQLAFGVGLALIFLMMITFSLLYAIPVFFAMNPLYAPPLYDRMLPLVFYWLIQLGFTVGVHWQGGEMLQQRGQWMRIVLMMTTTFSVGMLAFFAARTFQQYANLDSGEVVYRIFLAFYGLIFPAYVWLCMIPGRWIMPPTAWQWIVLAVSVVIAAPFFWMSFIQRHMIWIGPGLAVPILARLLIRSARNAGSTMTRYF